MHSNKLDTTPAFEALDWTGYPDNFPRVEADRSSFSHRKPLHGVGINDAPYQVSPMLEGKQMMCPAYTAWASVLERCSARWQAKTPTYAGVTVCEEWHSFMAFRRWYIQQPHYLNRPIDKDLLRPGNRVYGPDTCLVAPAFVNSMFLPGRAAGAGPAIGVTRVGKRFKGQLSLDGKRVYLGTFDTPEEANAAYRSAKVDYCLSIANQYLDEPRLHAVILDNAARVFAPQHYN